MNIEIVFDEKYPYTCDYFAVTLHEVLHGAGYNLKKLRYAKRGETGHVKVDNKDVDISHPIHTLVRKVELWTDHDEPLVVF